MFVKAGEGGFHVLTSLQQQTIEGVATNRAAYRKARAAAGFDPAGHTEVACLIDFGVDVEETLRGLAYLDELRRLHGSETAVAHEVAVMA